MIKVRMLRGAQLGLLGTTGMAAFTGTVTGCAEPAEGDDAVSDESAYTVQAAGTGVFELQYTYGTASGWSFALTESSTDEYVRARERVSFAIPAYFLWSSLYPNEATPEDVTRLDQLSAKIKASYVRNGAVYASSTVATNGHRGTMTYDRAATTPQLTIGSKADAVRFEMTITDAANKASKKTITSAEFLEVPVIGGAVPDKTLLFDSLGSAMRSRVLEGGKIVAGANVALGYTDWRASTVVDAGRIDRRIGTAQSFGRFGAFELPLDGELQYEVSYVHSIDGVWQPETLLVANTKSRLMPPYGRTAFEGGFALPVGAKNVAVAFHVKTYLVVKYDGIPNVTWRKYQDGERILVRDQWDNENGAPFDDWDFTTETR